MSQDNINIEQARAKLRLLIPPLVGNVFGYYRDYMESHKSMVNSSKYFREFSQAGSHGVMHLEKLLRLYRQVADADDMTPDLAREIAALELEFSKGGKDAE